MQSMIPALTERQCFWLKHIRACEASRKSIAASIDDGFFPILGSELFNGEFDPCIFQR